jgi:nitrite reductase/ring-hydroxylating ferredoxin subunit
VDASNASITSRYDLPIRQAAYRSYVVGFDLAPGEIPHALYWDTEDPYHYVRLARGEGGREVLIVGGADHRTGHGDPTASWDALEAWTRQRIPGAGAVVSRWSGQIMEPSDALGFIGRTRSERNVFLVSGDSGNGLTNGAVAGLLLPALIRGESHLWAELYAPTRRHRGLGTLVHESTISTVPYVDWLRPREVSSLSEIPPGHGAVLRHGRHRIAAYREPGGGCSLRSARCPHLSAVVRWNPIEHTWDCPAHGSRFDACGTLLNTPAASDLSPLDRELEAAVRADESGTLQPPRYGWVRAVGLGAAAALVLAGFYLVVTRRGSR